MKEFDGREFSEETINWKEIKIGDVVLEGINNYQYKILTRVNNTYWEYFEDGYYHSTSPRYCHWLVDGQKHCKGKLIKIIYE